MAVGVVSQLWGAKNAYIPMVRLIKFVDITKDADS